MPAWYVLVAIAGLAALTVLTRAFFLIPEREVPIPEWLREALRYAPLAALIAVLVPEVFITDDHLITTWKDARLFSAAASVVTFAISRNLLGTILAGSVVLLALRLTVGW